MRVRPARVEDARAIAEVHARTWQAAYAHVFPAEALATIDVDARKELWRTWIPRARVFVADDDDGVVGFVSVGASRDPDAEGELFAIYVVPDAWGAGAGPALIEAAEQALREAGHGNAILWVLDDNPRARRFYERQGWELDGAQKSDEFLGTRVTEVRYRRAL